MGTKTSLGLVSGVFGFGSGLLAGVWADKSDVSAVWGITLVLILHIVLLALIVLAQWRQVSAPALVGALLGGIMAAALIFGDFFIVAVTDESLADYGGDETWSGAHGFGLTFFTPIGVLVGFIDAVVIALVADALAWLVDHASKRTPRRHSPA